MWAVLFLWGAVVVFANVSVVRDVALDATTPVIALETNNQPGYVVRVEWCRSLYSNAEGAAVDIANCKAPGLMHMTLYPNAKRRYIKDSSTASTMFVDRSDIGGIDADHQFNIIVRTRTLNGTEYETVYRFNPLFTTTSTFSVATTPPIAGGGEVAFIIAGVPQESSSSWKVALSVFCIGMASVAGLAFLLYRQGFGVFKAIKNLRIYGGGYEFTKTSMPEEDFLTVESEQEILRNLGIGANEAYEENLMH